MRHILKGNDVLIAPFAIYMHQNMIKEKDFKRAGRAFHTLYPSVPKPLIAQILRNKIQWNILNIVDVEFNDAEVAIVGSKEHHQSLTKEAREGIGHRKEVQLQLVAQQGELETRRAHAIRVQALADLMNDPVISIMNDPDQSLPVEVVMDAVGLLFRLHVGNMLASYGQDVEFRKYVADEIGELISFVIGVERGDPNKPIPDRSSNKPESKKKVLKVAK